MKNINMKSVEKLDIKSKVLITKDPKERFVIDGFQLDEIMEELTAYSCAIEI